MRFARGIRKVSPRWLCIGAFLAIHLVLGIDAAGRLTVTHDEYWHLPAGLLAWKAGRFDADNLNPPLTRMWDALPLLFTSARVDGSLPAGDAFGLGDRFSADNRAQYDRDLTLARSMNLLFSVLTGLLLAVWANELFGAKSACLAVAVWCCCPTALAHAALVTPDMGATCLFTASLFFCWRFSNRPAGRGAFILGTLLGLAQLAKFTNLLLFPLCAATWFIVRARNSAVIRRSWKTNLTQAICAAAIAAAVLNAGYFFRGSFSALRTYHFQSRLFGRMAQVFHSLDGLPVPLPRDYVEGLDHQQRMIESLHPVYLDGIWSQHGFADYYLRALEYKLPHAVQALVIALALCLAFPGGLARLGRVQLLLWIPVIALLATASSIGMQLGIRYVLPTLPLAYLAVSQTARWFVWKRFPIRTLAVTPLIIALPFSLRYHPHHLAYFNELAGGPEGGRAHLLDSNLDWGQDLRALADYLHQRHIDHIGLAYFGMLPPSELGIHYRLPPSYRPEEGWFAVSANFLYGRPHTIRNPDGSLRSANFDEFGYFRHFSPIARIGYSIEVFHISFGKSPASGRAD
ncbi:MAG TPA: glycosyltransferase family 39 protein [Planctomycetaceae bacterium]|nr:glycosyltransferase family 39 protein [Planctomycetaceae bacterium]